MIPNSDNPTLQIFDPDLCRARQLPGIYLIECLSPQQAGVCNFSLSMSYRSGFYCLHPQAHPVVMRTSIGDGKVNPPAE